MMSVSILYFLVCKTSLLMDDVQSRLKKAGSGKHYWLFENSKRTSTNYGIRNSQDRDVLSNTFFDVCTCTA